MCVEFVVVELVVEIVLEVVVVEVIVLYSELVKVELLVGVESVVDQDENGEFCEVNGMLCCLCCFLCYLCVSG